MKGYITYLGATLKHKAWVGFYLTKFSLRLLWRALVHDLSKFSHKEAEHFSKVILKMKDTKYNSPEYWALMDQLQPALQHHYRNNPHHPEKWIDGIYGMELIDLVEMAYDWVAATKRHATGNPIISVQSNAKRFNYSAGEDGELMSILANTFYRMGYRVPKIKKVKIDWEIKID